MQHTIILQGTSKTKELETNTIKQFNKWAKTYDVIPFLRRLFHIFEQKLFPERETDIYRYTKDQMKNLFQQVGLKSIQQQYLQYFVLITIGEK